MKKRMLALVAVLVMATACTDPYECSNFMTTATCGSIQACCNSSDCEYRSSSGGTWECDGTDCMAAARRLVADCY